VKVFYWALFITLSLSVQAQESLRDKYAKPPHQWPPIQTSDDRVVAELAPLPVMQDPPNPVLVALGRRLFNDPILSKDRTVSCASCHEARLVFSDQRKLAIGIEQQVGKRNTPAIFGVDLWQHFFWDGRANTAEQQALMPIVDAKEMNASIPDVLTRLQNDAYYVAAFSTVFDSQGPITPAMLSRAIVAFERTITPPRSLFAKFIEQAYITPDIAVSMLNDKQLHGLHLFRTKAKCMTCHNGPLLSDNQFHVTGFHYYERKYHDGGRFDVTGDAVDSGAFRTPSLWSVSKTGPWLHNGLISSLQGMVNQYNAGGPRPKPKAHQVEDPNFPETTDLLIKLHLTTKETDALVAFLNTL
jgi:cytochrome c peroxidase